jgi:hypothetical protein
MKVIRLGWISSGALLLSLTAAVAQLPPPMPAPMVPTPNPSSSLVLPPVHEAPVSPAPHGGSLPGASGGPGSNLAGTNEVVNPPRSVFHSHHRHHPYVDHNIQP